MSLCHYCVGFEVETELFSHCCIWSWFFLTSFNEIIVMWCDLFQIDNVYIFSKPGTGAQYIMTAPGQRWLMMCNRNRGYVWTKRWIITSVYVFLVLTQCLVEAPSATNAVDSRVWAQQWLFSPQVSLKDIPGLSLNSDQLPCSWCSELRPSSSVFWVSAQSESPSRFFANSRWLFKCLLLRRGFHTWGHTVTRGPDQWSDCSCPSGSFLLLHTGRIPGTQPTATINILYQGRSPLIASSLSCR